MKAISKRLLIVSDNLELVTFFRQECTRQGVDEIAIFKYCYSSTNKNPLTLIDAGLEPINVKDENFSEIAKCSFDLIFSLHCKQIFPKNLVESITCINVHPGFNPYNRGWYPQVFSLVNKKPIGATIHVMDSKVDHGAIIDQIQVENLASDTSFDLYRRVIDAEKLLIKNCLLMLVNNSYKTYLVPSKGNYNSIHDFNTLCHLNINSIASLRDHIDLLRALSHGECRNAYFFDENGKKIYVKLLLELEK